MPYDEETKKLIENRKRNAELRKEKQLKKRKITLGVLGALIVVLVVIIIIAASASSKSDSKVPTTKVLETTYINETIEESTEAVTTQEATTEATAETTKEPETTIADETTTKETTTSAPETTKKVATGKTMYTNDDVNIRRKPKEKGSNIIDIVDKGSKVQVLGTEKGWSHVVWNGIEGYISARFLTENK